MIKKLTMQCGRTHRLVFLTITLLSLYSYSMEDTQNIQRKFRVFFLKNNYFKALNIRLKDSSGKNLIDMVHPDNGYCFTDRTVSKHTMPTPYYFILHSNETVLIFVDEINNLIRYPIRAHVWKESERPRKKNTRHSLFSFVIDKENHGKKIVFKSIKADQKFVYTTLPVAFLVDKEKETLLGHQELMLMFGGIYGSPYKNAVYNKEQNMVIALP